MAQQQSLTPDEKDELLRVLANYHCRIILSYFGDASDDVASVHDLVNEISKQDHGGTEQITIQLHHSALPRLADVGAVDYDPRSRTVRYQGHPELEQLMEAVTGH